MPGAQIVVLEQAEQLAREIGGVAGREQHALAAVIDEHRDGAAAGRDDRAPARHVLEELGRVERGRARHQVRRAHGATHTVALAIRRGIAS